MLDTQMPSTKQAGDASIAGLVRENAELRARLQEAEDTLRALRNGEIDAVVVGEDIYTLEGAEAASNRFRSDVLVQMEDAVVALDLADHLVYLNPAAERQYGFSASQALGMPREQLFRQEWLEPADESSARRALAELGFWRGRSRHVTRAGERLLVESTLGRLHDSTGAVIGSLAVIRNVSERAAAEVALRENRARLQFTLDSARIGSWDLDLDSDTSRRSLRHDQCFGYSEPVPEWGYRKFIACVHADDRSRVERQFRETIDAGSELHLQCRVIWPDGSVHWIEIHGSVFTDASRPRRMIGIVSDISERKRMEEGLRDADQRKDEFLATLAHELRNPLAPIRNSVHIMRLSREAQVHGKAQAVIERQLDQMVHLVDDLLDISRISQGKIELRKQLVDIAAVLRNAVDTSEPVMQSKGHQLSLRLPDETVLVDADMTRLTQVVSNLLNNAAKYTPNGGRISLSAEAAGGEVAVRVEDTGVGIPQEMLPRVFDMFTQVDRTLERSQGGLGIGLALVKRLVEMHGGRVEAHSRGENAGSVFTVRLPMLLPGSTHAAAVQRPATHAAAKANRRVLVVDDNQDGAESLAMTLNLLGHSTATAHDGAEGLRLAEAFRPDVVLLDIGLPLVNGYDVARRLRAQPWGDALLLVALTGWGQVEDRRRSDEAGFDQHLVKPVSLEQLEHLMNGAARAP
jgi:PAS domain S-box-containing protein